MVVTHCLKNFEKNILKKVLGKQLFFLKATQSSFNLGENYCKAPHTVALKISSGLDFNYLVFQSEWYETKFGNTINTLQIEKSNFDSNKFNTSYNGKNNLHESHETFSQSPESWSSTIWLGENDFIIKSIKIFGEKRVNLISDPQKLEYYLAKNIIETLEKQEISIHTEHIILFISENNHQLLFRPSSGDFLIVLGDNKTINEYLFFNDGDGNNILVSMFDIQ